MRAIIRDWPVTAFAVIVIAFTALVMLAGLGRETTPFGLVIVIPIAAIIAAWLVGGRSMVRGLFVRIARWRVPVRWYVVALGIPILVALTIDVAGIVTGQADAAAIIDALDASVLVVPLVVLLPALFEEFAWRGYGVEVMLERGSGFAKAALGVGVVFTAIHLPLYLPGHLYEGLPVWPALMTLLGGAVLLSWVYVGSGRSSLLAGICHAALNGTVPLTWGLDEVWAWEARGVVIGLVGVTILALIQFGPLRGTIERPRP